MGRIKEGEERSPDPRTFESGTWSKKDEGKLEEDLVLPSHTPTPKGGGLKPPWGEYRRPSFWSKEVCDKIRSLEEQSFEI